MNPFRNQIRARYRDDDELKAAAAKVRATMDSPGWDVLWQFIGAQHDQALQRLLSTHAGPSGRVLDQAEYARLTAYLGGIREPQTVADGFAALLAEFDERTTP